MTDKRFMQQSTKIILPKRWHGVGHHLTLLDAQINVIKEMLIRPDPFNHRMLAVLSSLETICDTAAIAVKELEKGMKNETTEPSA